MHADERVISIKDTKHWLWRAVDADGYVLEAFVQSRRDRKAALRPMRNYLRKRMPELKPPELPHLSQTRRYQFTNCGISRRGSQREMEGKKTIRMRIPSMGRRRMTTSRIACRIEICPIEQAMSRQRP